MNACRYWHVPFALALWLLSSPGVVSAPIFSRITKGDVVTDQFKAGTCAWADGNDDGYPDLFVASTLHVYSSKLYVNNRDGTFTSSPLQSRDGNTGGIWGDMTNDGFPDLLQTFLGIPGGLVLQINGGPAVDLADGYPPFAQPAAADFDNDGWLDFAVSADSRGDALWLYQNSGAGEFQASQLPASGMSFLSFVPTWGDADNDGALELFAVSRGGTNVFFHNQGNGTMTPVRDSALVSELGHGGAASWGDYNNDGFLDLFVASADGAPNLLFKNIGDGTFSKVSDIVTANGGQSINGIWGDFDNDGYLDLFLANSRTQNALYRNRGGGSFEKVETPELYNPTTNSVSCAWADYDSDGFLDLFVANSSGDWLTPATNSLFHNNRNSNHWLKVRLRGKASNPCGIGAKVRVRAVIGGHQLWQLREISGGNGLSQNELAAHFGLSDATQAEVIRVEWPSGSFQEIAGAVADFSYTVTEPEFVTLLSPSRWQVVPGTNLTFRAQPLVTGELAYQWRFNGQLIPGATNAEFTVKNVQSEHAGLYSVLVRDLAARTSSASTSSRVSLIPGPVITSEPSDASVSLNASATFQVKASSSIPLSYQWRKNGQVLDSAQGDSLTLTAIGVSDAGQYSVEVRSAAGVVVSREALLTVDSTFTKVTPSGLVNPGSSSACAWGDFDNDGWVDLFVANSDGNNYLYRNLRTGAFERLTSPVFSSPAAYTESALWADYDNDGCLDLAITHRRFKEDDVWLLGGDGAGRFQPAATGDLATDQAAFSYAAWGDYDNDGRVDLAVAAYPVTRLYHNDGQGRFTRSPQLPGQAYEASPQSLAWGDYNNDGRLDLAAAALFPVLFRSDPDSLTDTLAFGSPPPLTEALGCSWADYDNDGDLDLLFTTFGVSLYRNDGTNGFTFVDPQMFGSPSGYFHGAAWADYDNDGWADVFLANANGMGNTLLRNKGGGSFQRIETGSLVTDLAGSIGAGWADYDNDGDVDLYVANTGFNYSGGTVDFFYRNNGNTNSWLNIRAVGTASNRSAIGAKIRVKATIRGGSMWQLREISGGHGYGSQNDFRAAFGLGDAAVADIVRIEWPSGIVQELANVPAKQFLVVEEPGVRLDSVILRNGVLSGRIIGRSHVRHELQTSGDFAAWQTVTVLINTNGIVSFDTVTSQNPGGYFFRAVEQ